MTTSPRFASPGYFSLVLHAHLPFVRSPEHVKFLVHHEARTERGNLQHVAVGIPEVQRPEVLSIQYRRNFDAGRNERFDDQAVARYILSNVGEEGLSGHRLQVAFG